MPEMITLFLVIAPHSICGMIPALIGPLSVLVDEQQLRGDQPAGGQQPTDQAGDRGLEDERQLRVPAGGTDQPHDVGRHHHGLVGASRWYTQLPFILEAAIAGLIGGLLAAGGLIATELLFVDKTLSGPIKAGIIPQIEWGAIIQNSVIISGMGVGLAAIAAYVTLRLYVRLCTPARSAHSHASGAEPDECADLAGQPAGNLGACRVRPGES